MKYKRYFSPFGNDREHNFNINFDNKNNFDSNNGMIPLSKSREERHRSSNSHNLLGIPKFLNKLKFDDILLIGLIFILLNDKKGEDNQAFVIGLILLFLAEYVDLHQLLNNIFPC